MAIGLDHWMVMGTANLLGINPGPAVSVLTVGVLLTYVICFYILVQSAFGAAEACRRSEGLVAFIWFIIAVVLGTVLFILDLFHTLLLIWFGYSAMTHFRDWWRRGSLI